MQIQALDPRRDVGERADEAGCQGDLKICSYCVTKETQALQSNSFVCHWLAIIQWISVRIFSIFGQNRRTEAIEYPENAIPAGAPKALVVAQRSAQAGNP